MIINRIEASGIFSFGTGTDRFVLDLGEGLNVIVGPNAAGKTNVLRLIELVRAATLYRDPKRQERGSIGRVLDDHVRFARHDGMLPSSPSEVRLGLTLTSGDRALVVAFLQAMVLAALLDNKVADTPTLANLEAWVAAEVTEEKLASLYRGTIVVSHSGVPGTEWSLAYEFDHEGRQVVWHLYTPRSSRADVIEDRDSTLTGDPDWNRLVERLHGSSATTRPSSPQPPSSPFAFDALLPDGNKFVRLVMEPISVDHLPAPLRTCSDLAGPALPPDYLTSQQPQLNFPAVLSVIFAAGLRYPVGADVSAVSPVARARDDAVSLVSLHLFQLKNGALTAQGLYRDVQRTFSELVPGWRFEVRTEEQRSGSDEASPAIEIEVFANDGAVLPRAVRPIRLAGRGMEQALLLAEALVIASDQVLVLDEPATNLHPSWLRIVRRHLATCSGQCLLVTHSPYLMPAEDDSQLATIVRLSAPTGTTRLHRLSTGSEGRNWLDTITKELAWSADARGLLFANGVVLLEGGTELGALPTWFAKSTIARRYRTPEDLQIGFYSVGGDQNFGTFVRYLDRFGVPWAIACDGAAFRFDKRSHIFDQVLDAGVTDPELRAFVGGVNLATKQQAEMTAELFREMVEAGMQHGVFTLASGWHTKPRTNRCETQADAVPEERDDESFEAFVLSQPELREAFDEAYRAAPKSKPRAGRLLAEATACPSSVGELYDRLLQRLWGTGMPRLPDK